jgi:biopolymer transport protein ExbB/biopolymer transport protein TolQ
MFVERLLRIALLGSTWVLYLLVALSVLSLSAAIERWLYFARRSDNLDALTARFAAALEVDDFHEARRVLEKSRSIEAQIVREALRWVHGGPRAFSDALDAAAARARTQLRRATSLLGTLGNNAPFVGLLGTVIGVIEAFHQLGAAGQNHAAMGNVMTGIAEALVATGVGLFVALPAVVSYNLVQRRIAAIDAGIEALGKLVGAFVEAREHAGLELPRFVKTPAAAAEVEPAPSAPSNAALRGAEGE